MGADLVGPTDFEVKARVDRLIGDELLTAREVAAVMRIHVVSLHRWIAKGVFPKPIRVGAVHIRWRKSTVDEWLAARDGKPRKTRKPGGDTHGKH